MRVAAAVLAALVGCYDEPKPPCGFLCGPAGECPEEYTCGAEGRCRLAGTPDSVVCVSADAPVPDAPVPDAPVPDAPIDAAVDAAIDAP